jgi:hypothetical protein
LLRALPRRLGCWNTWAFTFSIVTIYVVAAPDGGDDAERSRSADFVSYRRIEGGGDKHLKVLREAGLVTVRRDGRRQMCALDPRPLTEVRDWLAHFDRFWDGKLDALGAFLDGDP